MTLFIRGWKKWGITNVEMDFDIDAVSLRGCLLYGTGGPVQPVLYEHPLDGKYDGKLMASMGRVTASMTAVTLTRAIRPRSTPATASRRRMTRGAVGARKTAAGGRAAAMRAFAPTRCSRATRWPGWRRRWV